MTRYAKLEQRLILLSWLNRLFGYEHNRDLLADMKDVEGFDSLGRSNIYHRLELRESQMKISLPCLARYDKNIREHLNSINGSRRSERITLRYFQHLAAFYAEVFLDWYFDRRGEMLQSLNRFARNSNAPKLVADPKDSKFSESDLKKLAFWMATGSGKTLIMHINYRQFLHYSDMPLDNIVLITPNEGMSIQHMKEMADSGIPCRRFELNESGLTMDEKDAVRVIEITKLVEDKQGGGVRVPVEAFEGNNLVFVDEGHKGSGGKAWRKYRDDLGETGFTFEYSATFGQALTAARNDKLTAEYGKSIVFDYSYRYFYGDGYGKDFYILNLERETTADETDMLLLGNLLSFYEQQRVFEEQANVTRLYNLERPLWIFVGSTVNAVYRENKRRRSDVLTVIKFLHRILKNRANWAVEAIGKFVEDADEAVLETSYGEDVFRGKFEYLRGSGLSPEEIYQEILSRVFHTSSSGGLHLCGISGSLGEIGLKVAGAEDYFGLIYIGDTNTFKKLVDEDDSGVTLEEDAVSGSLFGGIGDPDTSVNVLIGAKKFMEGWNSWRVSNMGLLNIGRKEGSEIIQLFGRGVRLRGKDFSLKRSAALGGEHPDRLGLLETLNIFAVRANYMSQFRDYLENEGVEAEGYVELPLEIRPNRDFLNKGLVVPRISENRSFLEEVDVLLEPDPNLQVPVDMSLKAQIVEGGEGRVTTAAVNAGKSVSVSSANLDLVDWEKVYFDLLEYKERRGFANLVIRHEVPRMIMETSCPDKLYNIFVTDKSIVSPESFADTALLQEAVVSVLRKYMDEFYRIRQESWDSLNMVYREIDEKDANFQDYAVRTPPDEALEIQKLIKEADEIYEKESRKLPTVHFDRHLYQPLLSQENERITSIPPGLNEGERKFVRDLRSYYSSGAAESLSGKEVYLLRNLSRGKGIGFFERRGFYPDFILWIKDDSAQRIIFIEPHGMMHAGAYSHDYRARLHESLPELAEKIGSRTEFKNVALDSFIISTTSFNDLRGKYDDGKWDREIFAKHNILFFERDENYDYLEIIMKRS